MPGRILPPGLRGERPDHDAGGAEREQAEDCVGNPPRADAIGVKSFVRGHASEYVRDSVKSGN